MKVKLKDAKILQTQGNHLNKRSVMGAQILEK